MQGPVENRTEISGELKGSEVHPVAPTIGTAHSCATVCNRRRASKRIWKRIGGGSRHSHIGYATQSNPLTA